MPRLWAVTLRSLRVLRTHWNSLAGGCRTAPATWGRREALPASLGQAVCGSRRRKANAHPAAQRGREKQAVAGLRAEQKQGVTKAKGKAQECIKGAKTEVSWRRTLAFVRLLH